MSSSLCVTGAVRPAAIAGEGNAGGGRVADFLPVWAKSWAGGVLYNFLRFGMLNIIAEHVTNDTNGKHHEEGIRRYIDLMNLLGVVSALLLSVATAPLTTLNTWGISYPSIAGRDQTVRAAIASLVLLFLACVANLLMVAVNTVFFLSIKDKDAAYTEIRTFPLFGVPIVAAICQFVCLLWFFCCYLFIIADAVFGYAAVGLCAALVIVGVPIWSAMFCLRLARAAPAVDPLVSGSADGKPDG